jgi:hypothetical protein
MNLSLINQNISAKELAWNQAKQFKTVLDAIEETCVKHNFKGYEDFLAQIAAFEPSTGAPVEDKVQEKESVTGTERKRNKKMTREIKEAIIKDLTAGKKVPEVMKAHGFSSATVNNIKKDAKLVTPRKPKEVPPAVPTASNVADLLPLDATKTTG